MIIFWLIASWPKGLLLDRGFLNSEECDTPVRSWCVTFFWVSGLAQKNVTHQDRLQRLPITKNNKHWKSRQSIIIIIKQVLGLSKISHFTKILCALNIKKQVVLSCPLSYKNPLFSFTHQLYTRRLNYTKCHQMTTKKLTGSSKSVMNLEYIVMLTSCTRFWHYEYIIAIYEID